MNIFFINLLLAFFLIAQISFSDEKTQIKQYETGGIYEGQFLWQQHGKVSTPYPTVII